MKAKKFGMRFILAISLVPILLPVSYLHAQEKIEYPDSLKSLVLKIDPFALLFGHVTIGAELPLKNNKFLDVNIGVPGVGVPTDLVSGGGVLFKAGLKFPVRFNSPFSIIYFMPEVAFSRYKFLDDYYNGSPVKSVKSTAFLMCLGYRHVNPKSRFYYDLGVDLGYGFANAPSYFGFNHILVYADSYNYSAPNTKISGLATSAHASMGIILRKKKIP